MAERLLRKYASTNPIFFDLFAPATGQGTTVAFAAGDVHVHINGASTGGNATNLPTREEGMLYKWKPTAAEITGLQTIVRIVDQDTTKICLDKTIIIETYGDTSALHTVDLSPGGVRINANLQRILGSTINALQTGRVDAYVGAMVAGIITSSAIGTRAIGPAKVAAGTITSSAIAAGAIKASKVAANTITSSAIAGGSLTSGKLAAGLLTSAKIAANAIKVTKIAANAIASSAVSTGMREKIVNVPLNATIADSIPADGTRPSVRSGILMVNRFLMERVVIGSTMTVLKEDGASTAMKFSLNSSTAPTSISRSA